MKIHEGDVAYLAGPMTGYLNWNIHCFKAFAEALREKGLRVLNPVETMGGDTTAQKSRYMKIDFGYIAAADIVLTMEGWESSEGAVAEVCFAHAIGKTIYILETEVDGSDLVLRRIKHLSFHPDYRRDVFSTQVERGRG